jgi:hypothetical protein
VILLTETVVTTPLSQEAICAACDSDTRAFITSLCHTTHCDPPIRTQFTFASNSPIPLFLTLHGTSTQALDMLSSAPNLCLLRTIALGSEAADESGARRSNNTFVSNVASAVFWPHESDTGTAANGYTDTDTDGDAGVATAGDPGVRTIRGELFVPKGLKQSFTFPRFACSVS